MKIKNLVLTTAAFASIAAVADVYEAKFNVSTVTGGKKANVAIYGAYDSTADKYAFWTRSNANLGTVEFDVANPVSYKRNVAKNVQLAWGENNVLVAGGFGTERSLSGKVAGIIGGAPAAGTWTLRKTTKTFERAAKAAVNEQGLTAKLPNLVLAKDADTQVKAAEDKAAADVKAAEEAAAEKVLAAETAKADAEKKAADAEAAQKAAEDKAAAAETAKADAEKKAADAEQVALEKGAEAEEATKAAAEALAAKEEADKAAADAVAAKEEADKAAADAVAAAEASDALYNDLIDALKDVKSIEDLMDAVKERKDVYEAHQADYAAWLDLHKPLAELVDATNTLWTTELDDLKQKVEDAKTELAKILRPGKTYDASATWYAGSRTDLSAEDTEIDGLVTPLVDELKQKLADAKDELKQKQDEFAAAKADLPTAIADAQQAVDDAQQAVDDAQLALDAAEEALKAAKADKKAHEELMPYPDPNDSAAYEEWSKEDVVLAEAVRAARRTRNMAQADLDDAQDALDEAQQTLDDLESGAWKTKFQDEIEELKGKRDDAKAAYDDAVAYQRDNDDTNNTELLKGQLDAAVAAVVALGDQIAEIEEVIKYAEAMEDEAKGSYAEAIEQIQKAYDEVTSKLDKIAEIERQLEGKLEGEGDAE